MNFFFGQIFQIIKQFIVHWDYAYSKKQNQDQLSDQEIDTSGIWELENFGKRLGKNDVDADAASATLYRMSRGNEGRYMSPRISRYEFVLFS